MSEAHDLPTVSVIIPAFNSGAFINQAIFSALLTRNVYVEVIVIDDESTDDTWRILECFGDPIRKIRQSKGGPYKARTWAHGLPTENGWRLIHRLRHSVSS